MAPIAPSSGTKVSSNSPITEKPGFIAADSLAAESVRDHGAFSANPSTGISGQSAKGMTANTSDTSAASVRPPAPNAEARMQQHKERKEHDMAEEAAVREQDRIPEGGPVGGMGGEVKGNAKTAPTGMWRNVDPAVLKAKGKNLKEGGFEGEGGVGEIGGDMDPSRKAEEKMIGRNYMGEGVGVKDTEVDKGLYGALGEERA